MYLIKGLDSAIVLVGKHTFKLFNQSPWVRPFLLAKSLGRYYYHELSKFIPLFSV